MGFAEALAVAVVSQACIAYVSVIRHRVHIDYLRADISKLDQSLLRAHQRIDNCQTKSRG
jgi:uncharacterized protein YccT (UPF0319 family)